jgi:lipoprotein NlpD
MTSPRSPAVAAARVLPRAFALLLIVVMLGACATRRSAPVEDRVALTPPPVVVAPPLAPPPAAPPAAEPDWRPQTYTVKRGDTLHQIALDHGLDYR